MTPCHHPSDALMLDYAAGSSHPAAELAVAAHLTFCPRCRRTSRLLEAVGGHFVAASAEAPPASGTLDKIMTRLAADPGAQPSRPAAAAPPHAVFPTPLREVLGCDVDGVPWRRLGMGAYHHVIPTHDPGATARLLLIPAGRRVPMHTHTGTELTLVLRGAFSDATGVFGRGDLQEADDGLVHQPQAAPSEDCICLAVTEAPLRFKRWAARLVQPLLGI